jgi:CRP/FNR family transcriptional regulator
MLVDTGSCERTAHVCRHRRSEDGCADCKVRLISVCSVLALSELEELEALSQHLTLDKSYARIWVTRSVRRRGDQGSR